ncbi:WD40/YVTN/BNR-like repeat-containing protein [Persicobacter diffluens]|uniref:Sortilin N-terminal domain-containing protein n=1 Tax=Persicobacter diffluens TaxID=981 RepID=A0AAN4VYR6_9BACT|nr:hypothetical protein PEDI_30410 [Persicobacter diffluens]
MERPYFFRWPPVILFLVAMASMAWMGKKKAFKIDKAFFNSLTKDRVTSDPSVEWVNFGPGMSGYNEEFWCHPTDPDVMFMGPDMHVAYGSWDDGKSWHSIKDYDGDGQCLERVHDIAFSRKNPDFGVALERRGKIFTTHDRGRSWELKHTIKREGKKHAFNAHTKIAIDPNDDNTWYIGAGDFWNVKRNHRSLKFIHGKMDPRASYGYVLKTKDGGKSWKKLATDIAPDSLDVARILVNPMNSQEVVMATNYGFFRSTDGGKKWQKSGKGLPNNLPRDLTAYYDEAKGIYELYLVEQAVYQAAGKSVKTSGGVYKSRNGGKSWENITGDLGVDFNQITSSFHRGNYHRVMSYWFGENSKKLYPEFPENTYPIFNRIVVNPINNQEIYLVMNQRHDKSFGPGDAWKTTDGGKSWKICARVGEYWRKGKDKAYWEAKGFDTHTNVKFAHLERSLQEENEIRNGNRMLAINARGEVFMGINQQTIRSNDGGKSWEQVDDFETEAGSNKWVGRGASNLPGRFMLLESGKKDRYLLCSGEHGLWQTADLGNYPDKEAVAVEQIEGQVHDHSGNHGAHSVSTVAVHPHNPDIIYIIGWRQEHRGKLRRSMDGGKSWENIATIFEGNNGSWQAIAFQASLMIDPDNPDNMYFCTIRKAISEVGTSAKESVMTKGGYGVYRSTDGGYNWALSNSGLPAKGSVRRMVMDPKDSKKIFACLNKRTAKDPDGLYVSIDGAKSWKAMAIPSEIQGVNNLFIDRHSGEMYLSAGFRDGSYESGGVWKSDNNGKSWKKFFYAPYVWQCEVSPVNPDIIVVNVPLQVPGKRDQFKNPGIYLTKDGGQHWARINKGLGQPDKMSDVKPDPYDEHLLWAAAWGSGWFRAKI